MSLLPFISEDYRLTDGTFIHAHPFCLRQCNSESCSAYYNSLKDSTPGFYRCPHGLSSLVYFYDDVTYIFSSLRESSTYSKDLAHSILSQQKIYNPILDAATLNALAEKECEYSTKTTQSAQILDEVNNLLHETRKLNAQIKTRCDMIWETASSGISYSPEQLLSEIQEINIYSFIVYNRFQYFDTILNPSLSLGSPHNAVIYKKFDKMRKLLRNYSKKNVWISLNTPSTYSYHIYQTFETLLFILLENSIKYSPRNNSIDVSFLEPDAEHLTVTIQSIGPYCIPEEMSHLGQKGFRGQYARKLDSTGHGIGLHFANKICQHHNIDIAFSSQYLRKEQGITYGKFTVTLSFDRQHQPQ